MRWGSPLVQKELVRPSEEDEGCSVKDKAQLLPGREGGTGLVPIV